MALLVGGAFVPVEIASKSHLPLCLRVCVLCECALSVFTVCFASDEWLKITHQRRSRRGALLRFAPLVAANIYGATFCHIELPSSSDEMCSISFQIFT